MSKIQFVPVQNASDGGKTAADFLETAIRNNPRSVLGLATGSTPLPLYRELIARCTQEKIDFSEVRTINLDEYVGLPGSHPQSYRYFMDENLFNRVNIQKTNTRVPDGMTSDPAGVCAQYEKQIADWGGIDLQLLGIGLNGHIGFNEPAGVFPRATHVVELTENTRQANKRFFHALAEVPTHAITMGIGTIMAARQILLVCTGANKAAILEKALFGAITPQVPASVLQLHQHVTVVADEPALVNVRQSHPEAL